MEAVKIRCRLDVYKRQLERWGVTGGNILEPSMGVGAFFGCRPEQFDTNPTGLYGVELDHISARIAGQLYQMCIRDSIYPPHGRNGGHRAGPSARLGKGKGRRAAAGLPA